MSTDTAIAGDMRTGLVADVVRFSWVDGPGNRYTVFFQGCNLNCVTCHNPHTITRATRRAATMTVEELVRDIRRYAPYLSGVTTSGGEATMQAPFVAALFAALQDEPATAHLSRYVDSNGCADEATWDLLLPVTDGVMLDLKALDTEVHRELTGDSNARVLASIDRLYAAGRLAEVRLLVVPGFNDSADTLRRTGAYLASHAPGTPVRVIGYRSHGVRAIARRIPVPSDEERAQYGAWVAESIPRDLVTIV
jgi:pyruvate-formate lyase-activating enzyme